MTTKKPTMPDTAKPATSSSSNAWSKPFQARVTPPPGLGPAAKPTTKKPPSSEAVALRERFLSTLLLAVGQTVVVDLQDGTKVEGVLHTASPFVSLEPALRNKYVLKATRGEATTKVLDMAEVACLHIKSLRLSDSNGAFTDTEISRSAGTAKEDRDWQEAGAAWTGGDLPSSTTSWGSNSNSRAEALLSGNGSAAPAAAAGLKGSIGGWDQFQANEELFNVKGSYDENLYTTELDKSKMHKEQIRQAEKLAREIESKETTNMHLAEERNQAIQTDYDEEDRYSGVLKKKTDDKTVSTSASSDSSTPKSSASPAAAPAPKMNYAAAAAKQTAPPGFAGKKEDTKKETDKVEEMKKEETPAVIEPAKEEEKPEESSKPEPEKPTEAPVTAPDAEAAAAKPAEEETKPAETEKTEEKNEAPKQVSKLNAKAKEFTLNINAKTFTPGGGGGFVPPEQPIPQQHIPYAMPGFDPNMHGYMHPGMGQPGMMMMNPQYPGMRYPGQYPGDQGPPVPGQPPQLPPPQSQPSPPPPPPPPQQQGPPPTQPPSSTQTSGAGSPMTTSEEGSQQQDGESSTASATQQQGPPPLQQMQHPPHMHPMPYGMPPGQYYGGHMPMHPQQQRGMPYPPQFLPQQMPGNPMYRQNYPMPQNIPPNMMRTSYYGGPGGPGMPYQPYGGGYEDDGYGGRGRGGRGRGGRGRGGRRTNSGRGRGFYNNQSDRQIPQGEDGSGGPMPGVTSTPVSGASTPTPGVAQVTPSSEAPTPSEAKAAEGN